MRGELVIVRCYGGIPRVVRQWSEDQHAVYVTNDAGFKRLSEGGSSIFPIGFPREDVFKYDPELADGMDDLYRANKWDWKNMESF